MLSLEVSKLYTAEPLPHGPDIIHSLKLTLLIFIFLTTSLTWACDSTINGIGRFHHVQDSDFPQEHVLIHSYTKVPFNSKLPTILFFVGGPGANPSSSEFFVDGLNVIFFEQRGVGCSRPNSKTMFLNPKFYSSEKTVQDAKVILDDYGVTKAFIYGHSYGSVLATMFASLFPEKTEKLILEGTIYEASEEFWKPERRRGLLQKTFDSLTEEQKKMILEYSSNGVAPSSWFSVVGMMMSYLDDGYEAYKRFLSNVLTMDAGNFESFISSFYPQKGFLRISPEDASDGEVVFGMITCKELSGTSSFANQSLIFDEN
jgi:proline iminopeptidase